MRSTSSRKSGKPRRARSGRRQEAQVLRGRGRGAKARLHPERPGRDHGGEGQVRGGRGIGRAELDVELPRAVGGVGRRDRADADARLAVLRSEVVEGRAPAVRDEAEGGDRAWRGEGRDGVEMRQHPGDEGRCRGLRGRPDRRDRASPGGRRPRGSGGYGRRCPRCRARRGARRWLKAPSRRAVARVTSRSDHRLVGGAQRRGRGQRDLHLVGAVFPQEAVGRDPGPVERVEQRLSEALALGEARQA